MSAINSQFMLHLYSLIYLQNIVIFIYIGSCIYMTNNKSIKDNEYTRRKLHLLPHYETYNFLFNQTFVKLIEKFTRFDSKTTRPRRFSTSGFFNYSFSYLSVQSRESGKVPLPMRSRSNRKSRSPLAGSHSIGRKCVFS